MRKYVSKWAYLACAIDTEGTVTISKHKVRNKVQGFMPKIVIANTNVQWLRFLLTEFNLQGSINKLITYPKHKQGYILQLSNLRKLIPKIEPYIKIKQKQLKLVKELLKINKIRAGIRALNNPQKTFNECELIYLKIKQLNKRGVVNETE